MFLLHFHNNSLVIPSNVCACMWCVQYFSILKKIIVFLFQFIHSNDYKKVENKRPSYEE